MFVGWNELPLDGVDARKGPQWLIKFYAKDKFAARWCEIGSRERRDAGTRTLEWDFGAALSLQWASLQPPERRSGSFMLTGPPTEDMDWRGSMASGKMGMRTFVAGLLMWANVLPLCDDGCTSHDWEKLAGDCIRVLRVRTGQEGARPRQDEPPKAGVSQGGVSGKRKRSVEWYRCTTVC